MKDSNHTQIEEFMRRNGLLKKVFKGPFLASFSIFSFFHLTETNVLFKSLTMTGFKLRIFGVGSDHSTN